MTVKNLVIRVDASSDLGSGHVIRCMTLARHFPERDSAVTFLCQALPGNFIHFLQAQGFDVLMMEAGLNAEEDAHASYSLIEERFGKVDWLIVDHYGLDAVWEKSLRPVCKTLMVIDDLANRAHHCDLLLDQNLFEKPEERYKGLLPLGCQTLLGPAYALLRSEFTMLRPSEPRVRHALQRILVSFGGSDPTNESYKVIKALSELTWFSEVELDLVIGQANPFQTELLAFVHSMDNVRCHIQTSRMATLMSEADLFIGGGGTTTWERLCLGVPTLTIAIAENQTEIAQAVHQQDACWYLGTSRMVDVLKIQDALNRLRSNIVELNRMASNSWKLLDGLGVARVADLLEVTNLEEVAI